MSRFRFLAAAGALVALAALTRFADLGSRFFHHDESIHGWMAHQLASGSGYQYNPTYHGPLLYHLEAVVFNIAGEGDFQSRVVPAAFGVAVVVLLIVLLRPHLGDRTALVAGALALISPSLTYYSRFNIHDVLVAALMIAMVSAPFDYKRTGLMTFAGAAGLAIVTKLNAYFILGTLALYLAARAAYGRNRGRPIEGLEYCRRHWSYVLLAAGLGLLLVAMLSLSTAASYAVSSPGHVGRAVIKTANSMLFGSFSYWWSVHQGGRLGGPFHFYLPILLIYDPLIFVGLPVALFYFMRRRWQCGAALIGILGLEWVLLFHVSPFRALFTDTSPIQGWHVVFATGWLFAGLWTVVSLWSEERDFLACWVFVAVLQLLLYSYANEKVPWLVVHIVVPALVVVAAFIADLWALPDARLMRIGLTVFVVVIELFTIRTSWIVNTRNRSNVSEPLLQIDYNDGVAELVRQVGERAKQRDGHPIITTDSAEQWPFAWYFRDLAVNYSADPVLPKLSGDVFITKDEAPSEVPPFEFVRARVPFYHWTTWMRNVDAGDLRGLLRFMLHHDGWGRDEGIWFVVWSREDSGVNLRRP